MVQTMSMAERLGALSIDDSRSLQPPNTNDNTAMAMKMEIYLVIFHILNKWQGLSGVKYRDHEKFEA